MNTILGIIGFSAILYAFYKTYGKYIMLGSWLEMIINIVTFGRGEGIALFVAKKFFDRDDCGCCQRKEWLNRLTNPEYNGNCGNIKLF